MCLVFEDVMWCQRWRGWDSPGKDASGWDQGGVSGYEVEVISKVTGRSTRRSRFSGLDKLLMWPLSFALTGLGGPLCLLSGRGRWIILGALLQTGV